MNNDLLNSLFKVVKPKEDIQEDNTHRSYYSFQKPIIIHSKKGWYFNGVLYEGENAEQLAIKARNQFYSKRTHQ